MWFWGSIIILVAFIGTSYAIVTSGGNEARLKQMEARIRKLKEAPKNRKKENSKEKRQKRLLSFSERISQYAVFSSPPHECLNKGAGATLR
jgi:hypothetical protein